MPTERSKYALIERERRFLVPDLPDVAPVAVRRITDRYIIGTQLRLRRVEGIVDGRLEVVGKLTQKLPVPADVPGRCGEITTIYVDEHERAVVATLPALVLEKTRLSIPPMGVDVFEGVLTGLVIAEAEFGDDDAMAAFVPPSWCGVEITGRPDLGGGELARLGAMAAPDARAALAAALGSASR
jgi:CYTH domain-containing protein